jgi:hypothetical protein
VNEKALAWTEAERGSFRDDYFSPVKIPTSRTRLGFTRIFRFRPACSTRSSTCSRRRSRPACTSLRMLRTVSLVLRPEEERLPSARSRPTAPQRRHHSQRRRPPLVDQFVEGITARSCYSMLDLLVGYDHRTLDVASRDLTSFQSPLGALRNTTLPQGSTNAVAIFHGDVTFILEPEIPNVAKPFLDDTVVMGPRSRYETPEGGYKTIPDNPAYDASSGSTSATSTESCTDWDTPAQQSQPRRFFGSPRSHRARPQVHLRRPHSRTIRRSPKSAPGFHARPSQTFAHSLAQQEPCASGSRIFPP